MIVSSCSPGSIEICSFDFPVSVMLEPLKATWMPGSLMSISTSVLPTFIYSTTAAASTPTATAADPTAHHVREFRRGVGAGLID